MKNIKIRVRNPNHSEQIQKMLFAIGFGWCRESVVQLTKKPYLFANVSDNSIAFTDSLKCFVDSTNYTEVNFDWLLTETHTVIIGGEQQQLTVEDLQYLELQIEEILSCKPRIEVG